MLALHEHGLHTPRELQINPAISTATTGFGDLVALAPIGFADEQFEL